MKIGLVWSAPGHLRWEPDRKIDARVLVTEDNTAPEMVKRGEQGLVGLPQQVDGPETNLEIGLNPTPFDPASAGSSEIGVADVEPTTIGQPDGPANPEQTTTGRVVSPHDNGPLPLLHCRSENLTTAGRA